MLGFSDLRRAQTDWKKPLKTLCDWVSMMVAEFCACNGRVNAEMYKQKITSGMYFNLENAVGREKDVQAIDLDSVMKKKRTAFPLVTLLVISTFFI
jgi:hypothetical protein